MKTLITIFGCLLALSIPSLAAEQNQDDHSTQLNTQKERLQDISDIASGEREAIENRYLESLAQLRQEALQRARRIRLRDRMLWTEFISESYQIPYADNYIYKSPPLYYDQKALKLHRVMTDSYFLNTAGDFLMNTEARKLLIDIINREIPRNSRNFLIRKEAQKLLDIMNYFVAMSEHLENQRARKLADLLAWEESLMADVQRTVREMASPAKETPYGTVIAVVDYDKGAFCMIEGIDELIKAGDTINNAQIKNVKIVKIDTNKSKVEFKRKSQQWAQTVGQSPDDGWK
ncbi:MAG: hypothetical protein PHQ35_07090 [Phycisphaerae bacterium]|nr:hypothetical protein [Phycisphaerae bacterium]MDD5381031.1 hypothetical protein [Phycisphaerae bacterium]